MDSTVRSIIIIGAIVLIAVFVMHSCKRVEVTQKSNDDQATLSVKIDKHKKHDRDDRRD